MCTTECGVQLCAYEAGQSNIDSVQVGRHYLAQVKKIRCDFFLHICRPPPPKTLISHLSSILWTLSFRDVEFLREQHRKIKQWWQEPRGTLMYHVYRGTPLYVYCNTFSRVCRQLCVQLHTSPEKALIGRSSIHCVACTPDASCILVVEPCDTMLWLLHSVSH